MKFKTFVIFAGATGWRVGRGPVRESVQIPAGTTDNDQVAEAIHASLKNIGYKGEDVILALGSERCLAASLDASGLPRKGLRSALTYRMEEHLPIAAEDVTADFIIRGDSALGVCVVTKNIIGIVEALERTKINISAIMPGLMLGLSEIESELEDSTAAVIWEEQGRVSIVSLEGRKPANWTLLPLDPEALTRQLRVLAMQREDSPSVWISASAPVFDAVSSVEGVTLLARRDLALDDAAILGAHRLQAGEAEPMIDLRRDALGMKDPLRPVRQPLEATMAAAVVLMVVVSLVMLYRASAYQRVEEERIEAQAQLYQETFPGRNLPAGSIRTLLQSEYNRATRSTSDGSAVPTSSALAVMRQVLDAMPEESSIKLERMEFEDDSFSFEGSADSFVSPEEVASAIKRATGMQVEQPNSRRTETGEWTFSLRGETTQDRRKGAASASAR